MLDGEEKLIQDAVRKGDSSAFGKLYDHYQPMIYRFVFIKVGHREEAEDITHQVFLQAWQNIRTYRHRGHPFGSWLYKIARNRVIDHYRSRKDDVSLEAVENIKTTEEDSSAALLRRMEMEKVTKGIEKLKQEYQDIIIFRFVEDFSVRETADIIHKTEGAVKLIQHRAIEALKKEINGSL
jgi:RNA polymerase sigma-70 factor (ECF subfamily)